MMKDKILVVAKWAFIAFCILAFISVDSFSSGKTQAGIAGGVFALAAGAVSLLACVLYYLDEKKT